MTGDSDTHDRSEIILRNVDDQTADELADLLADHGVRREAIRREG